MSAAAGSRYSRVIVTLDTSAPGQGALDAAALLAKALDAELAGLFIEDTNLLRVAALPFTRESGLASGTLRQFGTEDVQRALKAQAQRFRLMLADAAREFTLRWTFSVVQGSGMTAALGSRGERDLLVMSNAFYARSPSAAPQAVTRARAHNHRPVAAVYDASTESERTVWAAHEVAAEIGAPLLVLCRCERRLAAPFQQALRAATRPHSSLQWISVQDSAGALAEALRHHHAALLFCPATGTAADDTSMSSLMRQVNCPLVLVD